MRALVVNFIQHRLLYILGSQTLKDIGRSKRQFNYCNFRIKCMLINFLTYRVLHCTFTWYCHLFYTRWLLPWFFSKTKRIFYLKLKWYHNFSINNALVWIFWLLSLKSSFTYKYLSMGANSESFRSYWKWSNYFKRQWLEYPVI